MSNLLKTKTTQEGLDIHPPQLAENGCLYFSSSFCRYTMSTSLTPLS